MSFLVIGTGIGVGWSEDTLYPPPPLPIDSPSIRPGSGSLSFAATQPVIPIFLVVPKGGVVVDAPAPVLQFGVDDSIDWGLSNDLQWGTFVLDWGTPRLAWNVDGLIWGTEDLEWRT